ncbi:hypothetical protein FO519_002930 [Halicephalobus sp. NKZ332]|nr:hypothetical protein FO519_002930 [Halicephalobus sp. NKZ332]
MTEVLRPHRNTLDTSTVASDQLEVPEKKSKIESPDSPESSEKSDNTSNTVLDLSKNKCEDPEAEKEVEIDVVGISSENKSEEKSESPKPGPSNYVPQLRRKPRMKRNFVPESSDSSANSEVSVLPHHSAPYSLNSNYLNAHPLWDMINNFPKSIANDFQKFHSAMCLWRWHKIDGCDLVTVKRPNMELIPASIIQIPENNLPKMVSYKMTPSEAWMLNFINASVGNFNLGLQIFVNGDDLVEICAAERYYWAVKKVHLERLLMIYSGELPPGSIFENKNLVGGIINLKKTLVEEIKAKKHIQTN